LFKSSIRAGSVAAAIGLLSLGASIAQAASGPESLVDLIRAGNREAVLAAITSPNVDVNALEPDGSTPLLWATYSVDHDMVRALLDARANPDAPNQDGQTSLMLASSIGSLKIAQQLIDHGANVNAIESFRGQTALMWAAAEDHPDVVDLLLAHHADVRVRASYDDWPRQMTSEPRAQFRQTGGLTALLYATRSGCYRCAVAIVKAGADVNQPNPDGITPLINAIDGRSFDIAMFLLDKDRPQLVEAARFRWPDRLRRLPGRDGSASGQQVHSNGCCQPAAGHGGRSQP